MDENQRILKSSNGEAIVECNIKVHNIQEFCRCLVDWFSMRGFRNGGIGADGDREFSGIDEGAIF